MVQTTFAQSRKENLGLETIQNFLYWKICSHPVGFKCVRKLPKTQENPLNYQLCTSLLLLGKVHKQILSTHEMEGHVHPKKKWWSWFLQSRKCKFGSTYQTRLETSVRPKCSRLQSSLCKIWKKYGWWNSYKSLVLASKLGKGFVSGLNYLKRLTVLKNWKG